LKSGVPPPVGEGLVAVQEINLPAELEAGAWITGNIKVQNLGETDTVRVWVTTEWDGKNYKGETELVAGGIFTLNVNEGLIVMPQVDAVIKVEGQHLEAGIWKTDSTMKH